MIEISAEDTARIQAEFGDWVSEAKEAEAEDSIPFPGIETIKATFPEQPQPKRRGRFPYQRNPDGSYKLGEDGKPLKDESRLTSTVRTSSPNTPRNLVPAAPLSKRDERQVADRLQSILEGVTGVVAVGNEVFQMTEEEAKAISEPLSSYLIRLEPTSKVAKQILDEYDLVAVAAASAGYGVRVYRDLRKEREATKHVVTNQEPVPIRRRSKEPLSTDDGRSTPGIEITAGDARPSRSEHIPAMPGDGPQFGL